MPTYAGSSGEFSGVTPVTDVDPKPDTTPTVIERVDEGWESSYGGRSYSSEPDLTLRAYTHDNTGAGELSYYGARTVTTGPDPEKDTIDPEGDSEYEQKLKDDPEFKESGQLPLFHYEHRPGYVSMLYTTEGGGEHLVQPMLGRLANFVRGRGLSKPMASGSMTGYSARIANDMVEAGFMQDDPQRPVAERGKEARYGRDSLNERIRRAQLDDAERGEGKTFEGETDITKAAIERDRSKLEANVEDNWDKSWGPKRVSAEEVQQDTQTFKDLAVEVGKRKRRNRATALHKPEDKPEEEDWVRTTDTYDVPLPGF